MESISNVQQTARGPVRNSKVSGWVWGTEIGNVVRDENRKQLMWGVWDEVSTLDFILSEIGETSRLLDQRSVMI